MVPFRRLSQRHRRSQNPPDAADKSKSTAYEWQEQRDHYIMTFPIHPLPSMQGPFEESMLDATGETGHIPFKSPNKNVEARQQLLCRDADAPEISWNFTYNCHWRHHPRGKYHPLLKTIAQIVFGVHLLHQHLEKSVADVADILLKHVNELDGFLQRANEDIEGGLKDMLFRRKCLKVPMEHVNEFDRLLDDRTYRAQLLDGNVTIERTIGRMSQMLNDYLVDMSIFRDANHNLDAYLLTLGDEWTSMNEDVGRIYTAMCGNTGGWAQFLQSLVAKAEKLGVVLVQVSSYCNEIEKRCGAASRRSLIASRSSSRNSSNSRENPRHMRNSTNKPLPTVPNERPPFMTPISPDSTPRRLSENRLSPIAADPIRTISDSTSSESLQQAQSTSRQMKRSNVAVPPVRIVEPVEVTTDGPSRPRNPGPSPFMHTNKSTSSLEGMERPLRSVKTVRDDSAIMLQQDVYRPGQPVQKEVKEESARYSDEKELVYSDEKEVVVMQPEETRPEEPRAKEIHSPLLTGKDSAYSSISGASFASPTAAHPRSQSSQSAYPRAQFGLFPSSSPSTPKQSTMSMSGRFGAMSPASSRFGAMSPAPNSPMVPDTTYLPQRAQTSLSNNMPPPRRSLMKKSSLSSLKRLFSKRKHGAVDTIAE